MTEIERPFFDDAGVAASGEVGHEMKRELMDILACPMCKGTLDLAVTKEEDHEIIEGSLHCSACDESYPIEDAIPNLLPPDMRQ